MNLNKRQKMLSAVFCVGLVGLVADRTILRPQGGPATASAESLPASAPAVATPASPAPEPPKPATVAERLDRLCADNRADPNAVRDPFSLPPSWSGKDQVSPEEVPDAVREFLRAHQLKAVVVQGKEARALVDDRFLVAGDRLDGFQLVVVGDRSAVFECGGKQAILNLVDQEMPAGRPARPVSPQ